jgi:hypothetical protein
MIRKIIILFFVSLCIPILFSCNNRNSKPVFTDTDSIYWGYIQEYFNHYPKIKSKHPEPFRNYGIAIYKFSVFDTTRLIINETCTIKDLLFYGCFYSYFIDSVYVFSNFKLFTNYKTCNFDSAAARGTTSYYALLNEPDWLMIDCKPYEPLRITSVKGKVLLHEFSYGFLPEYYFQAIIKKKIKSKSIFHWYVRRIK